LRGLQKIYLRVDLMKYEKKEEKKMSLGQTLQKKRHQVLTKLSRKIQKKHSLELEINQECGELKKIEISLEMNSEKELEVRRTEAKC